MRRKPTTVKLIEGNPGKRPIKLTPPETQGHPECPSILTGEALHEWHRITGLLSEAKILRKTDGPALAIYCNSWARYCEAERNLATTGYVQEVNGFIRQSPWVKIADEAGKQCHKLLLEFGLTPASRHKIDVQPEIKSSQLRSFVATKGQSGAA